MTPLVGSREKCRQPSARGRRTAPKRGRPKSAPAVLMSDITNKWKRLSNQSMCLAMEAVNQKGSSISQAAMIMEFHTQHFMIDYLVKLHME